MQELSTPKKVALSVSILVTFFIVAGSLADRLYAKNDTYKCLNNFSDTLDHIRKHYVDDVDLPTVIRGAWFGLLENLDPYSAILSPDELKNFKKGDGSAAMTGIVMSKRHGYAVVVAVFPGSQAEKAGLEPGDYIRFIGEEPTRTMNLYRARELLQGAAGTELKLKILKARNYETAEVTLKRVQVSLPRPSSELRADGYAVLRIPGFERNTSAEVQALVQKLRSQEAKGIVIDLRGCAMGGLDEAVRTAGLFLDPGDVVAVKGRTHFDKVSSVTSALGPSVEKAKGENEQYTFRIGSSGKDQTHSLPVVIVIDRSTADAGEVFAAALLDRNRAKAVGRTSFGAGSIQDIVPLEDGAGLVLTVAKFYRSNGEGIQDKGIRPTEEVVPSAAGATKTGEDPFIEKALGVLKQTVPQLEKAA